MSFVHSSPARSPAPFCSSWLFLLGKESQKETESILRISRRFPLRRPSLHNKGPLTSQCQAPPLATLIVLSNLHSPHTPTPPLSMCEVCLPLSPVGYHSPCHPAKRGGQTSPSYPSQHKEVRYSTQPVHTPLEPKTEKETKKNVPKRPVRQHTTHTPREHERNMNTLHKSYCSNPSYY